MSNLVGLLGFAAIALFIVFISWAVCRTTAQADRRAEAIIQAHKDKTR